MEIALFRIVQETLQNVVKHARAAHVAVTLTRTGDTVVLSVTDDGVGFDLTVPARPTSFGLSGMHERAGLLGATLTLRSAPGQGTSIVLRLPVDRLVPSS